MSKHLAMTNESVAGFQIKGGRSRGESDVRKKKLKKEGSIKLSKSPSMRPPTRRAKSQSKNLILDSSGEGESSTHSCTSHSSICSDARTNSFQKPARTISRRSSFKAAKTLSRMSSNKFKKPLMRKFSGGTDGTKMKKSKSTRSQTSESSSNKQFQESKLSYESSCSSSSCISSCNTVSKKSVYSSKSNSNSPGQRSSRVLTRTASSKPLRVSATKMARINKSKSGSIIEKPTCSSTLKDAKFAEMLKSQQGGSESQANSVAEVCPFTYCSLHGHRHDAPPPPLKRLVSIRRRLLRTKFTGKNYKKVEVSQDSVSQTVDGKGEEEINDSVVPAEESEQIGGVNDGLVSEATSMEDRGNGDLCNDDSESAGTTSDKHVNTSRDYGVESEVYGIGKKADRNGINNQKYLRMWHLMYKHTVQSFNGRAEEANKAEQVEDSHALGKNETDEDRVMESDSESNQNKIDAIQMVQEAFDEILLPEIQDHSSDDHSIRGGVESYQKVSEHRHEDQNISDSNNSSLDNVSDGREEEETFPTNEEKTSSTVGDISQQKKPKSWSNLRRIIILKRFFKALEKVRKLNNWKTQSPPAEHGTEAEKISLRHQTVEERKTAEEWMLDYALQNVVSKLDPSQQRKVVQLVKAFETVLPFPGMKASLRSNVKVSPQVDHVQMCNDMLLQSGEDKSKESEAQNYAENMVGKTSYVNGEEHTDKAIDLLMAEPQDPANLRENGTELDVSLSQFTGKSWKEEQSVASNIPNGNDKAILPCNSTIVCLPDMNGCRFWDKLKPDDVDNTCHEGQLNREVLEVHKEFNSNLTSEPSNNDPELCDVNKAINITNVHSEQSETYKGLVAVDCEESIAANNSVVSSAFLDASEAALAARKENNGVDRAESGFPQEFQQLEGSEHERRSDVAKGSHLEKQSYNKLWFLVYKHMVSGIAAEGETNLPDGEGKHEMPGNISGQTLSVSDLNTSTKDIRTENLSESCRLEAIKLVEKAIDDILLPENKNISLDAQSSTGDSSPDHEPQERNSRDSSKENFRECGKDEAEECRVPESNITIQEEEEDNAAKVGSKNWSNLKKMILLKRFINALEKVRKFTPRGPRFLPLESDQEAEKVHLKHQNIDGRKSSEEWMLDHALQQAVSRLTPARKKKVKLLVQAFETVTPTMGG